MPSPSGPPSPMVHCMGKGILIMKLKIVRAVVTLTAVTTEYVELHDRTGNLLSPRQGLISSFEEASVEIKAHLKSLPVPDGQEDRRILELWGLPTYDTPLQAEWHFLSEILKNADQSPLGDWIRWSRFSIDPEFALVAAFGS